tara:strand:+ start:1300 stop:1503 length:204 start_codon:yes stop_codon:yes gene_type:complete
MNGNYKNKYVRIKLKGGSFTGKVSTEYQDVIDDHTREGWRFVQAFSPAVMGYGASTFVDLIFEKRVT